MLFLPRKISFYRTLEYCLWCVTDLYNLSQHVTIHTNDGNGRRVDDWGEGGKGRGGWKAGGSLTVNSQLVKVSACWQIKMCMTEAWQDEDKLEDVGQLWTVSKFKFLRVDRYRLCQQNSVYMLTATGCVNKLMFLHVDRYRLCQQLMFLHVERCRLCQQINVSAC